MPRAHRDPRPRPPAAIVAAALVGPAVNPLNTTLLTVALVPIALATGTTPGTVLLLVSVLYLTSAVAQPTMGALADHLGPRRVYALGTVLVAAGGLVPLLWPSFAGALTARVLLGLGSSAAYPSALALLRAHAVGSGEPTPPWLVRAASLSSLVVSWFGPPLGGLLVVAFGWSAVFAVNLPLAIAVAVVLRAVPPDPARSGGAGALLRRLDPVGITVFAVAVAALVLALAPAGPGPVRTSAAALAAAVVLVLWERRRAAPFLDVRMLAATPALARTYLRLGLASGGSYLAVNAYAPWLQTVLGLSADRAGLVQVPGALLSGVLSLWLVRSTRVRLPLLLGGAGTVLAGGGLALLSGEVPVWLVVAVVAACGPCTLLATVGNQALLFEQAPADRTGTAAGLSRTCAYLGGIAASSLVANLYAERVTDGGLHVAGLTVAAVGALSLLLVATDGAVPARISGEGPTPRG